ncbi:mucin-16-like [Polypterus senegalus]|uniref:mucin-16-like n=1 Tax=Polypterus senegalus TaxID=55291 RepID=UPI001964517F|nr:mucin-16-like [Polypterus senegalus]
MANNSLFVNGYQEIDPQPTIYLLNFKINFTLTNLPFSQNLSSANSKASQNVTSLISQMLQNTSMGSVFSSCIPISFSPSQVIGTAVSLSCRFKNDTSVPPFNKVDIYRQLNQKTNNGTLLGPYSIAKDSLYVNGYHEITPQPDIPLLYFTINFTLPNLPFSQNLSSGNSSASRNVTSLISQMLQNTTMGSEFSSCVPISFSPSQVTGTAVSLSCRFKNDTSVPPFNKVDIYRQLNQKTNNGTVLGPYSIAKDSLYVSGYREITSQPVIPLLQFIINFTLPNLPFSQNLSSGSSPVSQNVTSLISQMLQNTTMGLQFSSCVPISLSPSQVIGTEVSLRCKFKNDTSVPPFNKVDIYRQLNQKTNNGTVLGPYSIAKDSLYVSGYHEITSQPVIPLLQFIINFTLPNLPFSQNLSSGSSPVSQNVTSLISQMLQNTTMGLQFSSCVPISLSPSQVIGTEVSLRCKFKNDTSVPPFNKVDVYRQLNQKTNNGTVLGPYSIAKDSLYVSGYHEIISQPVIPLLQFIINFTLPNLPFSQNLSSGSSPVSQNVTSLISQMLQNTTMGLQFSSCVPISLSPSQVIGMEVSLRCKFKNDTSVPPFNKVDVYRQLNQKTNNGTVLGPYSIAKDSLYVSGYHEITSQSVIPLVQFIINFTLPNLPFTQNLSSGSSPVSQNVTSLISQMLQNTTMGLQFSSCVPISLSPSQVIGTAVSLRCKFKNDTSVPPFNKVDVYRQLNQKTNNGTVLGPYSIAKDSLYVSGYHEITSQSVIPLLQFIINFTLPNLPFTQNLSSGSSPVSQNVTSLISQMLQNTTMGLQFSSCVPISLSPSQVIGTAVSLRCKFKNDTSVPPFNKVDVYRQLNQKTNNGTVLGPYSIAKDSLYVSGYHEITSQSVIPLLQFIINFTLPNLPFTQNLSSGSSPVSQNVTSLISQMLQNTTMGLQFSSCVPISFSPSQVIGTEVSLRCKFKNDTSVPAFNKVDVYRQLNQKTDNGTLLGSYSMAKNSLYVSGYREIIPQPVIPLLYCTINFTLTNLPFSQNLSSGNSSASRNVTSLISQMLQNTTMGSEFSSCIPVSFSPSQVNGTAVSLSCRFKNGTSVPLFNKVDVYRQLNQKTNNSTLLGPYSMARDSLTINGYHEVTPNSSAVSNSKTTPPAAILNSETTSQPVHRYTHVNTTTALPVTAAFPSTSTYGTTPVISLPGDKSFSLNFTIINRNFTSDLSNPNSDQYKEMVADIIIKLAGVYKNSSLANNFRYCKVTGLRIGSVKVSCNCFFNASSETTAMNENVVESIFANQTNKTSLLGGLYQLRPDSLEVKGNSKTTPPAAILTSETTSQPVPLNSETTTPSMILKSETTAQSSINPFPLTFVVTQLSPTCAQKPSNCPTMSSTFHSLVDELFKKSVINSSYESCTMPELSTAGETMLKVNMSCQFKPINQILRSDSDKENIYKVFKNMTNELQDLGPFKLDKNSLFVNGYTQVYTTTAFPSTSTYGTTPVISLSGDKIFSLNFTIININFTSDLNNPNSDLYKQMVANITNKLAGVYKNSSLANNFRYCKVTGLRLGSVKVSCNCIFNAPSGTTTLNDNIVESIFAYQTNNTRLLGGFYQLRPDSLEVKDSPIYVPPPKWELSFWAIILIVIGIFVGLLLLCLLCFLASLLRRQKLMDSYNVMNLPYGQYYSHLK